jgi:hypothetical protein
MARKQPGRGTKISPPPTDARHHPNTFHGQPKIPHATPGYEGVVYCGTCHAIWYHKHWTLDEARYKALSLDPAIKAVTCPGCEAVERGEYDGEVTLRSPLIPRNEESVLGLIYNTERHIRSHNPIARIASLKVEGDTIHVLTISTFLAERIGKELKKAYDGQLELNHPEREEFIRVTWYREG